MRFLVIQQKMIGDVLTSTIICDNLKIKYPDCVIDYVVNEQTVGVIENHPSIDHIIVFKKDYRKKKELYRFLKIIGKVKYDAVIDAYCKIESNLISLFANSPRKISMRKWYSRWIYDLTYVRFSQPDPQMRLAIKNRLQLLEPFGLCEHRIVKQPSIFISEDEKERASNFLSINNIEDSSKLIMVSVLGSSESKSYPDLFMARMIDQVCEELVNPIVLFNYIPSQKQQAQKVYELCNAGSKSCIRFEVFARSMRDFLAVLKQCKVLVGNEGGAVNMAKALGIPTFCVFAPMTDKAGWSSNSEKNHIAIHLEDFYPELFKNKAKSTMAKRNVAYYNLLEPKLFKVELTRFLDEHV